MVGLHIAVGVLLITLNAAAGLVGGIAWYRDRPSIPFWYLLRPPRSRSSSRPCSAASSSSPTTNPRTASTTSTGSCPSSSPSSPRAPALDAAQREVGDLDPESLTADEQESLALAIVRREMGIMAVSCGVIFFLGLRAAGTSGL